jgi:hypothetical protein
VYTIYLKVTPFIILFYPSFSNSWKFQQVSFFHFHTWVHNISTTFTLLHPFFISSPFHWYQPPNRTCFAFLYSIFEEGHFCLFKTDIWGVSLWHVHAYLYCNHTKCFLLDILKMGKIHLPEMKILDDFPFSSHVVRYWLIQYTFWKKDIFQT